MTIVCNCNQITGQAIREAVRNRAKNVEAVGEKADAGTVCGMCQERIQEIINEEK